MIQSDLLDLLQQRVVLFDGANGTEIQAVDLVAEDYDLPKNGGDEAVLRLATETQGSLEGCVESLTSAGRRSSRISIADTCKLVRTW